MVTFKKTSLWAERLLFDVGTSTFWIESYLIINLIKIVLKYNLECLFFILDKQTIVEFIKCHTDLESIEALPLDEKYWNEGKKDFKITRNNHEKITVPIEHSSVNSLGESFLV